MVDFRELLTRICARPAMYVGRCSLMAVANYLDGYCHGLMDTGYKTVPMHGFMRWVEMRFLIRHSAWHWTRILLHIYGDDRAAFDALPTLYDEFVSDCERLGINGIEAEADR